MYVDVSAVARSCPDAATSNAASLTTNRSAIAVESATFCKDVFVRNDFEGIMAGRNKPCKGKR